MVISSSKTILAILRLNTSLVCAASALGKSVLVEIGGHKGTMTLPSLPTDWKQENALEQRLIGPEKTQKLRSGTDELFWGRPLSYPQGKSGVLMALIEITLKEDQNPSIVAQELNDHYKSWLDLFWQYVLLFTDQSSWGGRAKVSQMTTLQCMAENAEGKLEHLPISSFHNFDIILPSKDEALTFDQFQEAADLSSKKLQIKIEYIILLEAYEARKQHDYRKSIMDAASALEVGLTKRIEEEFKLKNISFGQKLLEKYKMLGNLFELARMIEIAIPQKDYTTLILTPRNRIIHKASFSDLKEANQVIGEVSALLKILSPIVYVS